MALSSRFATSGLLVIGGAFLAVTSMGFSAPVAGWISFGVSTGLAVLTATAALLARGTGARVGHSTAALIGLWSLIAALTFSGTTLTWLVFADAIALAVAGLADLTAHELTTERVVHHLAVTDGSITRSAERTPAAA